jgi:hypothetical protein
MGLRGFLMLELWLPPSISGVRFWHATRWGGLQCLLR